MDIRRNVLIVICILSASMILSSCDKGGNHTESELGGSNMSDVNDVVMNEEDKPVEPRDMYWVDENFKDRDKPWDKNFSVIPMYGQNLNIAVRNYNTPKLSFIIYKDGKQDKKITLDANQGKIFQYTITKKTDFRVVLNADGGYKTFTASIRARQFE